MKMRCHEEDVNRPMDIEYVVEDAGTNKHLSDAQGFKEVPSSQT